MLKIILISIYSVLLLFIFYFHRKRPLVIKCYYLDSLILANSVIIVYLICINSLFTILIRVTLISIISILAGATLLFSWFPHYTAHRNIYTKYIKRELSIDEINRKFSISRFTNYLLLILDFMTIGFVYYLLFVSEKLPFQDIIRYPLYSKIIIVIGFLMFIIMAFVSVRRNDR